VTRLAHELRAVLGAREPHVPRFEPSPAAIEEEAANRLYGERTGTVHASPASPPVPPRAARRAVPPGAEAPGGSERTPRVTSPAGG
jgi:hypothetical protein